MPNRLFTTQTLFTFFTKQATFNEEVNCIELSPSISVPFQAIESMKENYVLRDRFYQFKHGTLTKGEGSVQVTSLYMLVYISCF